MARSQDEYHESMPLDSHPDLPLLLDGRDEMNLAEYPIALLSDRSPKDVKTLIYKDRDETLTVTGSDLLGLPTALDIDVIIGLLYLTKKKNDFTSRTINFTRYELLQVLHWPDRGHYYERLEESLNRWVGVTLIYRNSWWDNHGKTKGNSSFHIIDAATIVERNSSPSQQQLPFSAIRWGEEFFRSCQANNLKRLDLDFYFSLKSSVSKQLYRFLDKRFYRRPVWTFDLRTLACEHVGLSRNYPSWKIKQKIQPAIDELVAAGFLRPMKSEEQYASVARGEWKITLAKNGARGPRKAESEEPQPSPLEQELLARGVTAATARELLAEYPEERIRRQLEHADFLVETGAKAISNRGAYLAKAIRDDFAPSPGFEPKADREKRREAEEAQRRQEQEEAQRRQAEEARERAVQVEILNYWNALSLDEQKELEAKALDQAEETLARTYREMLATRNPVAAMWLRHIREIHIRKLLDILSATPPIQ